MVIIMEELGVLYKATDPQGHCYIGQHVGDGSDVGITYFGSGKYFNRVRKKHGDDYFTYWVFSKWLTQEERNQGEIYYIKFFQSTTKENGYNIGTGGEGGDTFSNLSEEDKIYIKKKISAANNNKSAEEKAEIKINQSNAQLLRFTDSEEIKKLSESGKIAQNKLEIKKKLADIRDNRSEEEKALTRDKRAKTWANKSDEEKEEHAEKVSKFWSYLLEEEKVLINQKRSISGKTAQNRPEVKEKLQLTKHRRYHESRSIINPNCKFCIEEQ
jgi:hypothetical protein